MCVPIVQSQYVSDNEDNLAVTKDGCNNSACILATKKPHLLYVCKLGSNGLCKLLVLESNKQIKIKPSCHR